VSLAERIRTALSTRDSSSPATALVVELTGQNVVEAESLDIGSGQVTIQGGTSGSGKVRLTLPGVRVTGGSLMLINLHLCATEENRVQAGRLQCNDCYITSRKGCGILCLQKAKLSLTDCEVANCVRSGIGVNGKHTDIELTRCSLTLNNFSGLGVNHQARCMVLRDCRITENGYHGVWLNAGVVARWQGGLLSGNKLADKAGPGTLIGFSEDGNSS